MRLRDSLRMSYRIVRNSRSKSVFCCLIIFILSLLLMSVLVVGLSIKRSTENAALMLQREGGISFYLNTDELYYEDYLSVNETLPDREGTRYCVSYSNSFYDYDYYVPYDFIDCGKKNGVYVSRRYEGEYSIGDSFDVRGISLEVLGFYDSDSIDYITDISNLFSTMTYGNITYSVIEDIEDVKRVESLIDFVDDSEAFKPGEVLQSTKGILTVGDICVVVFIVCFVILMILSIGSIVNGVMITLDDEMPRLGMYKAIGMKNRSVVEIIIYYVLIITTIGVVLSSVCLYLFKDTLVYACDSLYQVIVDSFVDGERMYPESIVVFPWYLVLFTILAYFGFTFLFSYGRIKGMLKRPLADIVKGGGHDE